MDEIALLIIADDRLAGAGLAAVLADASNLRVVAAEQSRQDVADLLDLHQPNVVLWDLGWDPAHRETERDTSPLERLAAATDLGVPVVVLLSDEEHAGAVWHTGTAGLLPRSAAFETLVAALTAAVHGLRVFPNTLTGGFTPAHFDDQPILPEPLTPREEEVLALLAEGMTNRAIGLALQISEHTAKFHVQALMAKLGAQSRTEAVVRATRRGLLVL